MIKRLYHAGLYAALLLTITGATCLASELRMTPLVRAVERAKSCVVNIFSVKTAPSIDSLFSSSKTRKINGMGTGIIVDERGYIVTNNHVVQRVDSLRVTLVDGSTYDAQVISIDRQHDLAIIKINASRPLSVMPVGTSSDLMLGETVIAIGNAFGYKHSVTSGIISSLSRDVEVNETQSYKNLIQTDASINPGNSGGPLLNLDGEVVGINVAIRAGAQRIGFALPINAARIVVAKLLSIERLNKTYHGLLSRDVKTSERKMLVVESAIADSPADAAGFEAGDVVVKAGKVRVIDGADFERAMLGRSPGEKVIVQIRRSGRPMVLSLTLSKFRGTRTALRAKTVMRANNDPQVATKESTVEKTWRVLGMRLASINVDERQQVTPRYRGGMRVTAVRPDSPAALNGIQEGDLLVGLHVWETATLENVSYILGHKQFGTFNPLKFYIIRDSETLYGHMKLALHRE